MMFTFLILYILLYTEYCAYGDTYSIQCKFSSAIYCQSSEGAEKLNLSLSQGHSQIDILTYTLILKAKTSRPRVIDTNQIKRKSQCRNF